MAKGLGKNKRNSTNEISAKRGVKKDPKIIRNLLNEYFRSSTLHGLRYVTERQLSFYEKLFWLIIFVVSISVCFIIIVNLYIKWKSNPVIVTIDENIVSVSKMPFPSITICPQNKCKISVFSYGTERKKRTVIASLLGRKKRSVFNTSPNYDKFSNVATVCEGLDSISYTYNWYEGGLTQASQVKDIEEVAESLENAFERCMWRRSKISCTNLFKRVLTREGVCFNMNSMAVGDLLKLENIHNQYNYMDANSQATLMSGKINGPAPDLDIILKRNASDRDLSCNTLNEGFKIYMQSPKDWPSTSLYHYTALDNEATSLAVKCSIFETSQDLKWNTAEERQCYFEGEKNLTYFQTYTEHNCWVECLSKYTFQKCGCVGFYLPHNNSNQLCNFGKYSCIYEAEEDLVKLEAHGNISKVCNCLPACHYIYYAADTTISRFNYKTLLNVELKKDYNDSFQYSRLFVFFQQPGFVAMQRKKLFGWMDFIASCGGLLGLFLGFSVLSIVEIIYYITIRYWCSRKEYSKEKKPEIFNIF